MDKFKLLLYLDYLVFIRNVVKETGIKLPE